MVNVNNAVKSMVTNYKKDAFNLGASVFVVPRIRHIKNTRLTVIIETLNGALQKLLR
jgi:hypothetical protein